MKILHHLGVVWMNKKQTPNFMYFAIKSALLDKNIYKGMKYLDKSINFINSKIC